MADQRSGISYCDQTWNPTRGCEHVSEGCRYCWAERMAARQRWSLYAGLIRPERAAWNGRAEFAVDKLDIPLHWRKPRRVAVSLMGDLFHPEIAFGHIAAIYGVAAACPQHTFLILTKRPERRYEFARSEFANVPRALERAAASLGSAYRERTATIELVSWPLPNVWEGVSAENQEALEARWPWLARTPAALRWIACEPLLGPIDLDLLGIEAMSRPLDWVVAGGESGAHARGSNVQWYRELARQCARAGVPFHLKQFGAKPFTQPNGKDSRPRDFYLSDHNGREPREWPADLRVRQSPGDGRGRQLTLAGTEP